MKTLQKIFIIWSVTLIALIGLLVSLGQGYGDITVEKAAILIESRPHIVVVDVRTPAEFKEEHLDGAINLCIRCNPDPFIHTLDLKDEILLYCRSGVRSADGLRTLNSIGYNKVYNMLGGIIEWKEKGYPVRHSTFEACQDVEITSGVFGLETQIGEIAAIISESDEYIGYDSACQHIAAAVQTPCLTIFAGSNNMRFIRRWSAFGRNRCQIVHVDTLNDPRAIDIDDIIIRIVNERSVLSK